MTKQVSAPSAELTDLERMTEQMLFCKRQWHQEAERSEKLQSRVNALERENNTLVDEACDHIRAANSEGRLAGISEAANWIRTQMKRVGQHNALTVADAMEAELCDSDTHPQGRDAKQGSVHG